MSTYKLLTKHEMLQAFSESPAAIVGESTMKELMRVLQHLIDFSQSHESKANNALDLLNICLPEDLYHAFVTNLTAQTYPRHTADPGAGPVYTPNQDSAT